MTTHIELHDIEDNVYTATLSEILRAFAPEGETRVWAILEFAGRSDEQTPIGMAELDRRIDASDKGFVISWQALLTFADHLEDVWDTTIVGCASEESIPPLTPHERISDSCDYVISRFDSDPWEVFSRSEVVIRRFESTFRKVRRVD